MGYDKCKLGGIIIYLTVKEGLKWYEFGTLFHTIECKALAKDDNMDRRVFQTGPFYTT